MIVKNKLTHLASLMKVFTATSFNHEQIVDALIDHVSHRGKNLYHLQSQKNLHSTNKEDLFSELEVNKTPSANVPTAEDYDIDEEEVIYAKQQELKQQSQELDLRLQQRSREIELRQQQRSQEKHESVRR